MDAHLFHPLGQDPLVHLVKGLAEVKVYCVHIVSTFQAFQDVIIVFQELAQAGSFAPESMLGIT